MNRTSSVAVTLATFAAIAAAACSSAAPDSGLPTSEDKPAPSKAAAPASGDDRTQADSSPTLPSAPTGGADACGTKATSQECGDCCIAKKPGAWDAAEEVYFGCICADTTCKTACAESLCAATANETAPNAACETCLTAQEPACEQKAVAACDANADCKEVDACLVTSCGPIEQKEDSAGGAAGGGGNAARASQLNGRAATSMNRRR